MNEPTHLDLFSGIGGFALAARWAGFRTVGFCEIDPYCQKVLAKNFLADTESRTGKFQQSERQNLRDESAINGAPRIIGDIRTLNGTDFAGVTLITGGFPCQPFSCAGKRRGKDDDRALWPEMFRVISEARPAWVLAENVAGIINMELDNVLSDLEGIGYACRPFVIPACGVDARHRRNRVWIVGNATGARSHASALGAIHIGQEGTRPRNEESIGRGSKAEDVAHAGREHSDGRSGQCGGSEAAGTRDRSARSGEYSEHVADSGESGLQGQKRDRTTGTQRQSARHALQCCEWQSEPAVGRVANGIPRRVDRLKGLGNAIVPAVAYQILKAIADIENEH